MTSRTGGAREAQDKLKVPGRGLHMQHMPYDVFVHGRRVRFPNAVFDFHACVLTLHELSMLSLMNTITDKSSWETRIHYPDTVKRWRNELIRSPWTPDDLDVSAKAFDYCIEELQEKSRNLDTTRTVEVFETPDASVAKSKSGWFLTSNFQRMITETFGSFDWSTTHDKGQSSRTEGTRVLLINPSLYLGKFGSSQVLPSGRLHRSNAVDQCYTGKYWFPELSEGTMIDYKDGTRRNRHLLEQGLDNQLWSPYHHWLPADVTWRQGALSKVANIESYINNLHPSNNELYALIERSITESIPLWNRVLSSLDHDRPRRIDPSSYRAHSPSPPPELYPTQDEYWEWKVKTPRCIEGHEPGNYAQGRKRSGPPTINLTEDFPDGIQVIVKFESIELTPERPQLAKTDWQVEGMLNEHVCASSIIFCDSENVSGGGIEFHQRSDAEDCCDLFWGCGYSTDYNDRSRVLGIEEGDDAYQYLGRVSTPEGRLLAFPNVLHTRTAAFYLKDPCKPGHCRFLTLLLVDPYIQILSTANVTPRQRDWWARALYPDPRHRLGVLPPELFNRIVDYASSVRGVTSPQEAELEKSKREEELAMFRKSLDNHVERFYTLR